MTAAEAQEALNSVPTIVRASMRQEVQFGEGQKWGLHLGASLKYFGDVHDPKLGDQPHTGYDEWAYDVRFDLALDPNWTFTAVHQQLRQNDVAGRDHVQHRAQVGMGRRMAVIASDRQA